eukprot:TRINITY_DN21186_c0_g1_i1.p1 TRINITY_DN21186_c0_g1~~TRINITY_DN21186_c0_g1_i1.p1  ORF type:complete len:182 (-),score=13.41 TRINITY_DN21186_c0_g1_i1:33-578(-)
MQNHTKIQLWLSDLLLQHQITAPINSDQLMEEPQKKILELFFSAYPTAIDQFKRGERILSRFPELANRKAQQFQTRQNLVVRMLLFKDLRDIFQPFCHQIVCNSRGPILKDCVATWRNFLDKRPIQEFKIETKHLSHQLENLFEDFPDFTRDDVRKKLQISWPTSYTVSYTHLTLPTIYSV